MIGLIYNYPNKPILLTHFRVSLSQYHLFNPTYSQTKCIKTPVKNKDISITLGSFQTGSFLFLSTLLIPSKILEIILPKIIVTIPIIIDSIITVFINNIIVEYNFLDI